MSAPLERLLDLLDSPDTEAVGTSMRLPSNLRRAAVVATELGLGESTTQLAVHGLRGELEAFAQRQVLDQHYRDHPEARPDLAEIAIAAAEVDGNPLADRRDLITHAAMRVCAMKEFPTADDVLTYAAGLAENVA